MSESNKDNPLRIEKRRKLGLLRQEGINPYPYSYKCSGAISEFMSKYTDLSEGEKDPEKTIYRFAGRLMTKRPMGKAAFFHIQDENHRLQGYLKKEELGEEDRKVFELIDIGDIIGIQGFFFKTKRGELSLHCTGFTVLCKTLEALPEKFHGLTDIEIKYRHRHLDLIMNPESRQVFKVRSQIISEIRRFLDERGFMEVETPVLQPIYGGAAAYPFATEHRALNLKLFMKISPELYLKRLIVGGFEKVYEMGKNFRNEGIDRTHNPEFTMLEWYEAYTDYKDQMKRFEDLIEHLAQVITGSTKVEYQGEMIDFKAPWRRLTVMEGLEQYAGIEKNIEDLTDEELFKYCRKKGSTLEKPSTRGEMFMELFELTAEEHLIQPTFVIDHPLETSPLTKVHRKDPRLVERFEPFVASMEIGNSYSELNDPEDQRRRLIEQESKRVVDEEAQPMDEDFLHAIDVGMPPTGGVGIGIERIVMLLTNQVSIRDIIFFPTMKPK